MTTQIFAVCNDDTDAQARGKYPNTLCTHSELALVPTENDGRDNLPTTTADDGGRHFHTHLEV